MFLFYELWIWPNFPKGVNTEDFGYVFADAVRINLFITVLRLLIFNETREFTHGENHFKKEMQCINVYMYLSPIDNGLCTQYTVLLSERCVNCFARKSTYTWKTNIDITYTCTLHFSNSLNISYMYKCVFKKRTRYDNYHFCPYLM